MLLDRMPSYLAKFTDFSQKPFKFPMDFSIDFWSKKTIIRSIKSVEQDTVSFPVRFQRVAGWCEAVSRKGSYPL